MKKEVTFIHVSKIIERRSSCMLLPLGLVALANFLKRNHIGSEVIHLELEETLNPKFNLIDYLKLNRRQIICFDLHWHQQSYKVISTIKKIKKNLPNSWIIIGGFTASFFAKEILEDFKEIDFIIRGDSEIPLLNLVRVLKTEKKDWQSIPNLAWRTKNGMIINKQFYVVSQEIIDNLKFSDFPLIKNYQTYIRIRYNEPESLYTKEKKDKKYFYYICGRGCSVNCSFCGGSKIAQKIINNRAKPIFIKHKSVIRELKEALKYGLNIWYTSSFDPYQKKDYYIELFKKIRKEKLKLGLHFGTCSLPNKEFIDEFSKTFNKTESLLIISPESGSELIRRKNRGYFYKNNELIDIIKYADSKGIKCEISFTAGLSFEKREDILKTLSFVDFLRNNFKNLLITFDTKEMEPAAPWFLKRKKYGIFSERKKFKDFYLVHKQKATIGYKTNYFEEEEINKIIQLLRIRAKCFKPQLFLFFKDLLNSRSLFKSCDFKEIHKQCNKCKNFKNCFRKGFFKSIL